MHDRLSAGVKFINGLVLNTEQIIEIEDAIISVIKNTLPKEAQRVDVVKYLLNDVSEKMDIAKVIL